MSQRRVGYDRQHGCYTYAIVGAERSAVGLEEFCVWIFGILALGDTTHSDWVLLEDVQTIGITLWHHVHVSLEHHYWRIFTACSSRNSHQHVADLIDLGL